MGSALKELHKLATPHGNGSMTWKIWPDPAPRVPFHRRVDLAASTQPVFTSQGAVPERYGTVLIQLFQSAPHVPFTIFSHD